MARKEDTAIKRRTFQNQERLMKISLALALQIGIMDGGQGHR